MNERVGRRRADGPQKVQRGPRNWPKHPDSPTAPGNKKSLFGLSDPLPCLNEFKMWKDCTLRKVESDLCSFSSLDPSPPTYKMRMLDCMVP